jgi:chromosome segregation ATPase
LEELIIIIQRLEAPLKKEQQYRIAREEELQTYVEKAKKLEVEVESLREQLRKLQKQPAKLKFRPGLGESNGKNGNKREKKPREKKLSPHCRLLEHCKSDKRSVSTPTTHCI